MASELELRISGVCAIVLWADSERPTAPRHVEGLVPQNLDGLHCGAAHGPRLSYDPRQEDAREGALESRLHVAPGGNKHGEISLQNRIVSFRISGGESFHVAWAGDEMAREPATAEEVAVVDWVAPLEDLGVNSIRLPTGDYDLPTGVSSRWKLPAGRLRSGDIVKSRGGYEIKWDFPATGAKRVLAEYAVLTVSEIHDFWIEVFEPTSDEKSEAGEGQGAGEESTEPIGRLNLSPSQEGGPIVVNLSNDLVTIPRPTARAGLESVEHLRLIDSLALDGSVEPPTTTQPIRSGAGICDPTRCTIVLEDNS